MIVVYYLNIGVTTSQCSFMALDWGADRGAVLCTPAVPSHPSTGGKKDQLNCAMKKILKLNFLFVVDLVWSVVCIVLEMVQKNHDRKSNRQHLGVSSDLNESIQ